MFERIVIEYPSPNIISVESYEEGFYKYISCIKDTVAIVIHCGHMAELPLTDLSEEIIYGDTLWDNNIRKIRGYSQKKLRKKYFREDYYYEYHATIFYMNVDETKLKYYEQLFDNVKIGCY